VSECLTLAFWTSDASLITYAFQLAAALANPIAFAVCILLTASICRRNPVRRRDDFVTALGLLAVPQFGIYLHWLVRLLTPMTIDGKLMAIDHSLGISPDRFASWMYMHHPHFFFALAMAYSMLAPVIALTWIAEQNHALRRALLIGASLCWLFYVLFPAVGPIYYTHPVGIELPRNCFPSMHFTWALLLALNSRSWLRWPLWLYSLVIAFSTIATGQHYVIDLIAALPYTAAVQFAAMQAFRSRNAAEMLQPTILVSLPDGLQKQSIAPRRF
jgi:membrane-associated phospholipid phosphatase